MNNIFDYSYSSPLNQYLKENIDNISQLNDTFISMQKIGQSGEKYIQEQESHDIAMDKLSVKEYEDPFKGSK